MTFRKFLFLLSVLACIVVAGCKEERTEYSEKMTEEAQVLDVIFSPARHGSDLAPTIGFTSSGDISFGVTSVDVHIPEVYAVVFRCEQHKKKFIIQNPHKKARDLWQRLKKDQVVTVEYREIYQTIYEDGKQLSKKFVDYEFINAY